MHLFVGYDLLDELMNRQRVHPRYAQSKSSSPYSSPFHLLNQLRTVNDILLSVRGHSSLKLFTVHAFGWCNGSRSRRISNTLPLLNTTPSATPKKEPYTTSRTLKITDSSRRRRTLCIDVWLVRRHNGWQNLESGLPLKGRLAHLCKHCVYKCLHAKS